MLLCVSWSIEAAGWAEHLNLLQSAAVISLIVGYLLARSSWPGPIAHSIGGLSGLLWVGYLGTTLFPRTEKWGQRLAQLVIHVALWAEAAVKGENSADNLVFVLTMALLIWGLGYTATWLIFRRHNALVAVLVMGSVLLVNVYYAQNDGTAFVLLFLWLSFLLIIRSNLTVQEEEWRAGEVRYNPDLAFYFLRDGAFLAVIVMAMAWFAPASLTDPRLTPLTARLAGPWHQMQQHWGKLFSSLHYGQGKAGTTYFGTTLAFSGPVNLSDRVVLKVQADGGRYWRGAVYDKYSSAGWVNTDNVLLEVVESPTHLPVVPYRKRHLVTQTYQLLSPNGNLLFAAAQPAQVSLGTRALLTPLSSTPASPGQPVNAAVISMLYSMEALYRGQQYQVNSYISYADAQSLRQAGTDYPAWVRARYLQLPDSLPDRVRQEARRVVGGLDTPYDKAKALETYLRGFRYNEAIPAPPAGQDGVDYFLFDIREGYCDYYASSLAVMLRSVGVPARISSGYAQGEKSNSENTFVVRERDAHSWVEVYFPGYGWVEFEPTAAEPPINRPETGTDQGNTVDSGLRPTPEPGESTASRLDRLRDISALGDVPPGTGLKETLRKSATRVGQSILVLGLLSALLGGAIWYKWQREQRQAPTVLGVYRQVKVLGLLGGVPAQEWQTVREYAAALAEYSRLSKALLLRLADLVTQRLYAPDDHSEQESRDRQEAETLWQRIRWPLIRFALRLRWPRR